MGPLQGLKVIEMAGLGPGPFCAMMLSDMGADVLRIDRADAVGAAHEREPRFEILNRGRPSVAIDLKKKEGAQVVLRLIEQADILIEGVVQPSPAPRFSRTRPVLSGAAVRAGQKMREGPINWGFSGEDVDFFIRDGIAVQATD